MTFSFSDKLALSVLFLNFYVISNLPFFYSLNQAVTYLQIFLVLVFILTILDFEQISSLKIKKFDYVKFFFYLSLICLMISAFYYNLGNLDIKSFIKILTYPSLIYIFFYFFSSRLLLDTDKFEKFLSIILTFVIINTLFGIFTKVTGIFQKSEYSFHFLGFFSHPNTVAFTFTIGVPILIYKRLTNQIKKWFFYVFIILFMYALLFTLSRAGFMGVAVAILILTYTKSKKIFFFTLILFFLVGSTFVVELLSVKANSSLARALLVLTAVDMITQSKITFLWGYGVFNSIEIFKEEKVFFGSTEAVVDPHNVILLLGIQFGMIFTALILFAIFSVYIKYFATRKRINNKDKPKLNLCLAITVGLLIQNILEDILVYPEYFVMPIFLFFLGYIYNYCLRVRHES